MDRGGEFFWMEFQDAFNNIALSFGQTVPGRPTSMQEEVEARYDLKREPAQTNNFIADQRIAELNGCL
jgi:hypothetical protein